MNPTVANRPSPGRAAPSAPPERPFRVDIAGLRAVAVLAVVVGHAGVPFTAGGYVGVDVFFVISGFLITANLADELTRTGRIRFARFYARRMVRLLPASVLVVLLTMVGAWCFAPPMVARAVTGDALATVVYGINVKLAVQNTNYLSAADPPSPLQHFWSLAVEEQFYLFWPVLLAAGSLVWFGRARPSLRAAWIVLAGLGAASLAVCVWLTDVSQPWAYFSLPARAWELAAGALVALSARRLVTLPAVVAAAATWLGLAAIGASVTLYSDATAFPGIAALLPVGGAALVIAGGCTPHRGGAGTLLGLGPMRWIGALSYSWYLWHWPVLILAPHALGHEPGRLTRLALVTVALAPAWLSLVLVEDRVRFQPVFRRGSRPGLVLGLSLSLVVTGGAVIAGQRPTTVTGVGWAADTATVYRGVATRAASPRPDDPIRALIEESARATALPANLRPALHRARSDYPPDGGCIDDLEVTTPRSGCDRFGVPAGERIVVLFGDSHARQWFGAVEAVARERGWRLVSMVKGGCAASTALIYKAKAEPYTECMLWREKAIARINALAPTLVVMSEREVGLPPLNATGTPRAAWASVWRTTIAALRPSGAELAVILDTPDPRGVVVPDCVARHRDDVRPCNRPQDDAFDPARRAGARDALVPAGVTVVDPTPWFCAAGVCPAIIGDTLVYRDKSHVTATYIGHLGGVLDRHLPDG